MTVFLCSSSRNEEKGQIFCDFLSMDTKPRNPKIVKMEQNDRKINFDSTSTKAQLIFFFT